MRLGYSSLIPRPQTKQLKNEGGGVQGSLGELTMAGCQLIETIRSPRLYLGGCGEVGEGLH